jgi:serine/threonine protein kinase
MEEGELEERPSSESVDTEEDILRSVAIRSSANVAEVKYMPEVDLGAKGVLDGFRVNLDLLPEIDESIPRDLPWETFEDVQHTVDSSSCHIYTARWGTTPVILKLIKEDRITSAVAVAEFDIEERVLSRVRHPHIVRLLGSGTQPRKFLVLEFLSGGTLSHSLGVRSDRVKQRWLKKFTLLETLKLAHGLAQALNYLHNEWSHSVHIIHRDLKPDNIGWSADGVLKLFDFGLSVSVRAQRERTEQYRLTGNTGTLRYMAPEVVLGRSYHQSVDTYSFGILIWQVAAGQIPFKDMGKKTYFDKVVMKGVRPQLDVRWPPAFGELLRKCWHEDKNARPSFEEISRELAQLVADEEEIQSAKNNNIVARVSSTCLHYVTLLHPLYIAVSLLLLAVSFVLSTQHRRETDNDVSAGAALAAFSALALYASLVNYFCGAWPLVPLQDPAAKLNFSVTAEVADGADQAKPSKKAKKDKAEPAEVELTQTHSVASATKASSSAPSSLFGAARKSDKGIMMTDPSTQAPPLPPRPPAMKDNGDEVEIGFNDHAPPAPAPSPASKSRQSGRGLLAGLQEKVARGTSRAGKQSRRKEGAGTVIFSPLNNLHDEEDEDGGEEP